jgi:hypothetical protein
MAMQSDEGNTMSSGDGTAEWVLCSTVKKIKRGNVTYNIYPMLRWPEMCSNYGLDTAALKKSTRCVQGGFISFMSGDKVILEKAAFLGLELPIEVIKRDVKRLEKEITDVVSGEGFETGGQGGLLEYLGKHNPEEKKNKSSEKKNKNDKDKNKNSEEKNKIEKIYKRTGSGKLQHQHQHVSNYIHICLNQSIDLSHPSSVKCYLW